MGSTPSHTSSAFVVANCGKTRPGQSQSMMDGDRWIVWKCLVFPGVEDTLTFFSPMRALIVLDFPTLGYPTSPTLSLGVFPPGGVKTACKQGLNIRQGTMCRKLGNSRSRS